MSYEKKQEQREAWLRRLKKYWSSYSYPQFNTRIGEIYEVDFGMNVGTEFSGRHLAICLRDSSPSQETMLVVPLTTKFDSYNVSSEDMIRVPGVNGKTINAGVAVGNAVHVSKLRIFRVSKILEEPLTENITNPVKGFVYVNKTKLKRWISL